MSGITSTISDSGRVYLFERNALPKNFIESGMKLTTGGLSAIVGTGSCDIRGKYHELTAAASIVIPQRMTCLLYAAKSDLVDTPTLGYVQAAFPAADAGTVCRWIIDGSATIASTVGTNDLTRSGTVTQVDGWIGYGGRSDGSTGHYASANSTGFPTGAAVRELDALVTINVAPVAQEHFLSYGVNADTQCFKVMLNYNGNGVALAYGVSSAGYVFNSGFSVEAGKTYFMSWLYNGTNLYLYMNGQQVYSTPATLNTAAGVMNVLKNIAASNHSTATIHYVELRNADRTPAQIAAISNALLLPCRYYASEAENTYTDVRAVLPSDTISLGRIRTSTAAITEARMDYQDGRREGAWGGNRRVFLGWQAFSGISTLFWDVPFDTRKVRTQFVYAEDANGTNECDVSYDLAPFTGWGLIPTSSSAKRIGAYVDVNRIAIINGAWKNSGYLGCYAEVME